jgi:hypothetical protein
MCGAIVCHPEWECGRVNSLGRIRSVKLRELFIFWICEGRKLPAGRPNERVPHALAAQLLTIIIAQGEDWRAHSQIYDSLFGKKRETQICCLAPLPFKSI